MQSCQNSKHTNHVTIGIIELLPFPPFLLNECTAKTLPCLNSVIASFVCTVHLQFADIHRMKSYCILWDQKFSSIFLKSCFCVPFYIRKYFIYFASPQNHFRMLYEKQNKHGAWCICLFVCFCSQMVISLPQPEKQTLTTDNDSYFSSFHCEFCFHKKM